MTNAYYYKPAVEVRALLIPFRPCRCLLALTLCVCAISGKCQAMFDKDLEPDKNKAFKAAFGMELSEFYADLNAWLLDPKAKTLVPTRAEMEKVLMTAQFPRPAAFPVTLLLATPRS